MPLTAIATLGLAGCSFDQVGSVLRLPRIEPETSHAHLTRRIEIEVTDPASGLPCTVVDRPDAGTRKVLWRAQYEPGFCHRKAEETRAILQARGWACRPESVEERRGSLRKEEADAIYIAAAWRCLEGLRPSETIAAALPPVPAPKPARPAEPGGWGDADLRAAVEKDLSAIGQDVLDRSTRVDTALGDLDDDGVEDAIVVLTRNGQRDGAPRLLMAYLGSEAAYHLVDVWILDRSGTPANGEVSLAIEGGVVRLDYCCGAEAPPTNLVLDDRKLAYARDG